MYADFGNDGFRVVSRGIKGNKVRSQKKRFKYLCKDLNHLTETISNIEMLITES